MSLGLSRFISDRPCLRGHTGPRYTLSRNCVQCTFDKVAEGRREERARFMAAKARREAERQAAQEGT